MQEFMSAIFFGKLPVHGNTSEWGMRSQLFRLRMEASNDTTRKRFLGILEPRLADRGYCSDRDQLLRTGAVYNPRHAGVYVMEKLLSLLPER